MKLRIVFDDHDRPNEAPVIDTGHATVHISEAYVGPIFTSGDGEQFVVMMRDGGFEFNYRSAVNEPWYPWEAKNGSVRPLLHSPAGTMDGGVISQ